ncbi:response regulator transcription factor [Pedobacter sp. KBS0701]|uniref:LytR/AlgR family response regulator transcription factor n=1 Tax=Pedobacter sp. KBS0701 TaxID=2578106 RepID=UPI00110F015A|nr:LytTR family DNA-binding domain-containing protein [Pedobacter sp. KBS0701]QDW24860.1 response regulator transcription factor [Pedobacter sp. KBS0701]
MYKCIVIDDEPHAIVGLKKYLESVPNIDLVAAYSDPYMALTEIETFKDIDLILMDIDMPNISGIELSKSIRAKTRKLIFTTGHTKYGYEAFKADADDYLLKPYTLGEFLIAINKALIKPTDYISNNISTFLVKNKDDGNRIVAIKYCDVIAVESQLNYVSIYTLNAKVTAYMSLGEMFKVLSQATGFLQFHRSFIISYNFIDYIDGNTIKMKNGLLLTVREYYKKSFTDFLNKNLIRSKNKMKTDDHK